MFKFSYLIGILLLVIAFITNPKEKDFRSEVEDIIIQEMKLDEEQNIVGEVLTSKLLQTVLWAVVRVDFKDYKLCSFFELKIGERQVKFFGVFGQVIPISGKQELSTLKW